MDQDLKHLIESSEFQQYHKALQDPDPPFNLFDVLRYADYEIRHSNVLAWLLDPGQNHGIGNQFLREFIQCLNKQADNARIDRVAMPSSLEADNVTVCRELNYVDMAIFFKEEGLLLTIENKTVERDREHYKQIKGYVEQFRETYGHHYNDVHGILLTTSREGDASEKKVIHVSWHDIHAIIEHLHRDPDSMFQSDEIRTFIRQYLEVLNRLVIQPEVSADAFGSLLGRHRPILTELRDRPGGSGPRFGGDIDERYGRTLDRLVEESRREPERLRMKVGAFLRNKKKFNTWTWTRKYSVYYLYFSNESMERSRRALNVGWLLRGCGSSSSTTQGACARRHVRAT